MSIFRPSLRYSLHGIQRLTKYLEHCTENGVDHLDCNTVDLCCETLKIIFNLLLSSDKPSDLAVDTDNELQLQYHLMKIIRQFLLINSNAVKKKEALKRSVRVHSIELLF